MMKHTQQKGLPAQSGFTLFIAIIITSALAVLSIGIISLVVRESLITDSSRESQYAFYAADTGAECAIYWDTRGVVDAQDGSSDMISPFIRITPGGHQFTANINCNDDAVNFAPNQYTIGHNYVGGAYSTSTTFAVRFKPDPYCAEVTVVKGEDGSTKIESLGYNTSPPYVAGGSKSVCGSVGKQVQRAVRVTY